MDGEQDLLHDVLGIVARHPGAHEAAPRQRTQHGRETPEQPVVRSRITLGGGPHQVIPIGVTSVHAGLPNIHTLEVPRCYVAPQKINP